MPADSYADPVHFNEELAKGEPAIILADNGEMQTWDREVAPRLFRAQSYAQFATGDAREIVRSLRALPIIPEFETKALAMVNTAISDLRDALAQLEGARDQYTTKPVAAA